MEGVVGLREAQVLCALSQDSQLDMQIFLSPSDNGIKEERDQQSAAALTIIVYGPLDLFDDVGDFFQTCDMYLQDPVGCDRNVRYCNPHRLSGLEEAPMTLDLDSARHHMHISEITRNIDLLEGLNAPIDLPETESPPALVTSLLR